MSHGTGTGYSTTSAFWIPDKPPPPAEKAAKAAHKGSAHASAKLKTHAAFGGKGKRSSSRPSKKSSAKSDAGRSGPPEVRPAIAGSLSQKNATRCTFLVAMEWFWCRLALCT